MREITLLLNAAAAGKTEAENQLWELVYGELRLMAQRKMALESREITLQATVLVHEAWLRLAGADGAAAAWDCRAHFFSAASEAMRRILVDQSRRRLSLKRGGGGAGPFSEPVQTAADGDVRLLQVHDALDALAERNPQQAQIVKLLYFAELTQKETADLLGVCEKTVQRQWTAAKAWLFQVIKSRGDGFPGPDEKSCPP
ncbi:MAG: polymerase sigma factor [Verrucomicrobiales bacterium]|nr:polymerase sigma factor [Verrucomicrobiales bacterium]